MDLSWLADPLLHRFWWRAAVLAALLGISGACLGTVLVARRLSLVGDGLSHALLPGIGLAWLVAGTDLPSLAIGAAAAGILALLGAAMVARLTRLREDAAMAVLLALGFSSGVVLVAKARPGVDLTHILFGNLLAIGSGDLWLALAVSVVVVWTFALGWRAITLHSFDPGYTRLAAPSALRVHPLVLILLVAQLCAGLRAMGAATTMGLILLPAATAHLWCATFGRIMVLAAVLAVAGSMSGMWLAWHLAVPPGPCVVVVLGLIFIASALLGRRGGALALRQHASHQHGSHHH